jgi:hypothetical protein
VIPRSARPSTSIPPSFFLPTTPTRGFDNIAGALAISPALLEGYAVSAREGSVAWPSAPRRCDFQDLSRVPEDSSQECTHIAGMPFATRGGLIWQVRIPAERRLRLQSVPDQPGLDG